MSAKKATGRAPAPTRFVPGEIDALPGEIEINTGRRTVTVTVANTGDRPIQVGSHYHFFETNDALEFDRPAAWGCRLDIASGTAVRFEPGQRREVQLVEYAGDRQVYGFAGRVMGALDGKKRASGAPGTADARKAAPKQVESSAKAEKATRVKAASPKGRTAKAAVSKVQTAKPAKPAARSASRREKKA